MSVRNLDKLLGPKRVAVFGAGAGGTLGDTVLGNLLAAGFDGVVYPVAPGREATHGIQAYASVADAPETPDLAVICSPAGEVAGEVRACAEAGVGAVAILSAGFREAGEGGRALESEVRAAARPHDGLRILGPNCLGVLVPRQGLNASFAMSLPEDGRVAFVSQSRALAASMVDWATGRGFGFSHVVSVGNMLDVDLGDIVDYLGEDRATRALVLYVETVTEARKFMSAVRAFASSKPIVAFKSGRFPASAEAALSHIGLMAGTDAVYDAAFDRGGIVRVERIQDVFSTAELLARTRPRRDARLGIVTNAGGPAIMAADELLARGGELAVLSDATRERLGALLPPGATVHNPVDVLGDAEPERYRAAAEALLDDPGTDAVLAVLAPQAIADPTATARALAAVRVERPKPLLAAWMGGPAVQPGRRLLSEAGIAVYDFPEPAVDAVMHLVSYARRRETLHTTPRALPISFHLDPARLEALVAPILAQREEELSETAAKVLLEAYEIRATRTVGVDSAEHAAAVADGLGYPVVLKIRSPDVIHKSDVGGVATGISGRAGVLAGYEQVMRAVRRHAPSARIDGITVQPMATSSGQELFVGALHDPTFGAVIAVGAGGVATDMLADRALALPPLDEALARRMLESLRVWPLLTGHRGRPGVDLDALLEALMRFSYLVADHPALVEVEVNPLLATPDGVLALDARARLDLARVEHPPPRFSHLAIRPYPEEYRATTTLPDGTPVVLRPIQAEDEPAWRRMLERCSERTIRGRFRGLVKDSHDLAARYCFVDYDREMALVAEVAEPDGTPALIATGRLIADPDHRVAEYALLIADPWQGAGLSRPLTDRCLAIARDWGVETVYAETTPENRRMIRVLERHGFVLERRPADEVVLGFRPVAQPRAE